MVAALATCAGNGAQSAAIGRNGRYFVIFQPSSIQNSTLAKSILRAELHPSAATLARTDPSDLPRPKLWFKID
jgi:hypothetical protein